MDFADDINSLLTLERIDRDLFRGRNLKLESLPRLFGGQVAAQCLMAAAATVEPGRLPNSFHGYFLRLGRTDLPVVLEVNRDRDGRSFSARRVIAVQNGEVLFSMVTSFHAEVEGSSFDDAPRRTVPKPEETGYSEDSLLLEVRHVTPNDFQNGVTSDCLWVRSPKALGNDPLLHRAVLAYIADFGTGFGQQDSKIIGRGGPSIDYAMWFQQDIKADDWVLVDLQPVKAYNARGCYHGSLRDRHGALGATMYQELLLIPGSPGNMWTNEPTPSG